MTSCAEKAPYQMMAQSPTCEGRELFRRDISRAYTSSGPASREDCAVVASTFTPCCDHTQSAERQDDLVVTGGAVLRQSDVFLVQKTYPVHECTERRCAHMKDALVRALHGAQCPCSSLDSTMETY